MRARTAWLVAALLLLPFPASAQDKVDLNAPPEGEEAAILVVGKLPRCRAISSDPLEAADYSRAGGGRQVLKPDPKTGELGFFRDDDPITAAGAWDRAGSWLGDYVYRAPRDGTPLCIGSNARRPRGWGQLRRVLDAKPTHGKYVRFTAFVATNRSDEVRFWLAAGDSHRVYQGGDTSNQPLWGTHGGWIPVSITLGPIARSATKVSYGFLLMGKGIVWVHQPKVEILDAVKSDGKAPPLADGSKKTRPQNH
jgi:hypothetical protein